jgi:solute carrier family 50 (sugar transporter)
MMDLVTAISWMGTASGVILLSAPITTIRGLAAAGDVGAVTCTYYTIQLLNCTSWVVYGLLVQAYAVTVSNVWGMLVAAFCSIHYLRILRLSEAVGNNPFANHTNSQRRVAMMMALIVCLLLLVIYLLATAGRPATADIVGTFSGATGVLMLTAPLERIRHIIRTKSAAVLSPSITSWGVINRATWACYAILAHDPFILVPNSIGLLVGVVSAALLWWFRTSGKAKTDSQMV